MDVKQYEYIASQLTSWECRQFVASLYFVSYELPSGLAEAEKKVRDDVPCIELLLKWNGIKEKWGGRGMTHERVQRRLRQIGKKKLADWLGNTSFHQLAQDLDRSLFYESYSEPTADTYFLKAYVDKEPQQDNQWLLFDFVLWLSFLGLFFLLFIFICVIIYWTYVTPADVKRIHTDE